MLKTAVPWGAGALALAGSLVYVRRTKQRSRYTKRFRMEGIRDLSREELQRVLADSFRTQGYAVELSEPNARGADSMCAVLRKTGQQIVVGCIHRTGESVGVEAMHALYQSMLSRAGSGALMVTSEQVTHEAKTWIDDKPIGLIEGRALLELLNRGAAGASASTSLVRREPHLGPPLAELLDCPLCGAPMVRADNLDRSAPGLFTCSVPRCPGTRRA